MPHNDHTNPHDQGPQPPIELPSLSAADARAVDALFEAGLDATRADSGAERARVRKAAAILNLLDATATAGRDPTLVDVTLARVLRSGGVLPADDAMTFEDAAALDAWVMNGYQAERVPGSLRERARRHERLGALVAAAPANLAADSLVERTLERVQASIDGDQDRMRLDADRARLGSGLRLADLISVAAVLLIAGAVIWPVFHRVRDQSRQFACQGNMASTARAFGLYATSNRESLPVANASLGGGGTWWNVGDRNARSNSANLFQLTRSGYARLGDLACPGNPSAPTGDASPDATDWRNSEEVSYSYRIMFGKGQARWSAAADGSAVVMADRSPVVVKSMRGEAVSPLADSMNHRAKGQHVLFSDGHADWLTSPELPNGDNIWLPRFIERKISELMGKPVPPPLSGQEVPEDVHDAFVGP
jgi:hypothetical protein